jgi:hypothetical protein
MQHTFDSHAEEAAFNNFIIQAYGYRTAGKYETYDTSCKDAIGTPFNWKPDYIPLDDSYPWLPLIEFKTGTLNSRKEKLKADIAHSKALNNPWGKQSEWLIHQNFAWSNSKNKHSIVQASMPPLKHLIVFKVPPTLREAKAYDKLGLLWCTLAALPTMLGCIKFAHKGLHMPFTQHTQEYSITHNLGARLEQEA